MLNSSIGKDKCDGWGGDDVNDGDYYSCISHIISSTTATVYFVCFLF